MKKIMGALLIGLVSAKGFVAAGTDFDDEIVLEPKATAEGTSKIFVKPNPKLPGVQAVIMGNAPEIPEREIKQREMICVLKVPGHLAAVFNQELTVIEGQLIDTYIGGGSVTPRGGTNPVLLKSILPGVGSTINAGMNTGAQGSSDTGGLQYWSSDAFANESESEEETDDSEIIEINSSD